VVQFIGMEAWQVWQGPKPPLASKEDRRIVRSYFLSQKRNWSVLKAAALSLPAQASAVAVTRAPRGSKIRMESWFTMQGGLMYRLSISGQKFGSV
jgi:hypothetical protein